METEQTKDKLQTSQHSRPHSRWIGEQLTIVAEAMGEAISPARLKIYAANLADLDRSQLEAAFAGALSELKFFPKIAELRELAGAAAKNERSVEAEAAWKYANDYLRKWGVDLMPIYSGGKRIEAPPLPPRIDYALRRIGGLRELNQITAESRPFMFKDFCEAYNLAPMADAMAPQLVAKFPIAGGQVKQLSAGVKMQPEPSAVTGQNRVMAKPGYAKLGDAELDEHQARVKRQAESVNGRDLRHGGVRQQSTTPIPTATPLSGAGARE